MRTRSTVVASTLAAIWHARSSCRCRTRRCRRKARSSRPRQADAAIRVMAARRNGVDHPRRHAATDQPILAESAKRDIVQARFDEVEALVEPIAAEFDVMRPLSSDASGSPGRTTLTPAERERIHAERARHFVHRQFDGEIGLAQAIAAKRAARHRVGVDGITVDLLVRAAIERHRLRPRRETSRRGRDCHRRRCWRPSASQSQSAGRRGGRRP